MATTATFGDEARHGLLRGVDQIAAAVKATLGPRGRTVLIRKAYGQPRIVNDGVTVARAVEPSDPIERTGAEVMRAAAIRTGDIVGDGTTTATVLAQAMVREGVRAVAAGMNPMDLRRGIDAAVAAAVAHLRASAHPVSGHEDIVRVGTISANGDAGIGALVADAMERVGPEGAVTIEEAKGRDTELEIVEGMQIDRGYLSPYFVTDVERAACVLENPSILIHERRISDLKGLLPLLEKVVEAGHALLVVAEDLDSDVLATLVLNALRGGLKIAAIKAPEYGERRKAVLQDMAVVTGATPVSDDLGITLETATLDVLGRASRVIVERDATTIVGGAGRKEDVDARCAQLRRQVAETTSDYDRETLQRRLAKLVGGVAVIRAGGATELEVAERKDRVDDAVHATRAAVEEGVVPGGGVALLYAAAALDALSPANEDQRVGIEIVRRSLSAPVREIAANAGVDGAVVAGRLRESGDPRLGYDAQAGAYVDMIAAGILDPAKVVRLALENAASVAGLLITTEVLLVETPPATAAAGASPGLGF